MAPPSALAIATGSVQRLVKEETSYHKELKNQETRLEKLVTSTEENENKEYQLKQEVGLPPKQNKTKLGPRRRWNWRWVFEEGSS